MEGGEYMLTPFGFKGKIRDREIEFSTEEEFFELLREEESDINEDADSRNTSNHDDSKKLP